jgi:hypothetical protein
MPASSRVEAGPDGSRSMGLYETLGLVSWAFALITFLLLSVFQWVHGRRLVGFVSEYCLLNLFIILVVLMIAGQLGAGLGIPGLFRDAPPLRLGWGPTGRYRGPLQALANSGAFLGAFGATLLIAQVWTSIYFADVIYHPDQMASADSIRGHSDLLGFLYITCPPFLILLGLAAAFPAPAPGVERRGLAFFVELSRYVLGVAAGIVIVWLGALAGASVHQHIIGTNDLRELYSLVRIVLRTDQTFDASYQRDAATVMTSYGLFVLITWCYLLILGELLRKWLSPGLAICLLFGYGVIIFSVLVSLKPAVQLPVIVLAGFWLVLANQSPYKYRFPGMDTYQERRVKISALNPDSRAPNVTSLKVRDALEAWWWKIAKPRLPAGTSEAALRILTELRAQLPAEQRELHWRELDALRKELGPQFVKPKLVLIAVTGAAYRSAFWTGTVLDELCCVVPGLCQHIRVLTGASGGMVGAAYFAAMVEATNVAQRSVVERLRDESRLDSLTPIIRRLLPRDLPHGFWPLAQKTDRGTVLEDQWETLTPTFEQLLPGEQEGWRPSLIISPMVVETGRRLLFSNLDLADVAATMSRTPAPDGSGPGLYSRPATEFFQIFPDAYSSFRVRTAVRMNATFPYISPAVSLPTEPPRRVVDAGYYDNYGVNLATTWAYLNHPWITENTSGLGLVQIRAFPSEARRKRFFDPDRDAPLGWAGRIFSAIRSAFQWLTSPAEGAASAMQWSMSFRNDEQVRALDDLCNQPGKLRFFETFIFENPLGFAMNWFLSEENIADMRRSVGAGGDGVAAPSARAAYQVSIDEGNQLQKQRLLEWWGRK